MKNARSIAWMLLGTALVAGAHIALDVKEGGAGLLRRATLSSVADGAVALRVKHGDFPWTELSCVSGEWMMTEPFSASADKIAVMRLLDALAFVPVVDSMSNVELERLGGRREDFGLRKPRVTVVAAGPGGTEEFSFGAATPAGDCVYVEVAGDGFVYIVGTNVFDAVDMKADDLRSRSLFTVGADEIGAFDVRKASGSFMRFTKDGEKWRMTEPHDSPASSAKVRKFLETVLDARAASFVWPVGASNETETASVSLLAGYGLDPESSVTVTFKGADGADRLLSLGKEAETGYVYALAHNGGAVVTVASSFKDIVLDGIDGFLDTRLFPYDAAAVTSVSLADGDEQYLLAKDAEGQWRLDAPVVAPADQEEAVQMVSRILALHHSAADASGIAIAVSTNSNPLRVSREAVLDGHRLEDLRSKTIASLEASQIRRIVSTASGSKPVSIVYDSDRRAWNVESSPDGGVADSAAVDALLEAISPLTAERVVTLKVGPDGLGRYGLDTSAHVVAVDLVREGSVRRNILVGGKAPGGRYATFGSADAVFILGDDVVKRLTARLVGK